MKAINRQLININYSKGVTIVPKYIVIHDTDNLKKGANAMANRNYFANNVNAKASAHYVVDENNIIQCLDDTARGWHVGDNKGYSNITNSNSIGIEICVNEGANFDYAISNAIDLTRYLLDKFGLGIDKLVMHNNASGKYCSRMLLDTGRWKEFKDRVAGITVTTPPINDTPPSGIRTLEQAKTFIGTRTLELQQKLNRLEYGLVEDGIFGMNTYRALIDFQRKNGLTVDALAGDNTFKKLRELSLQTLKLGSKGDDVRLLQKKLGGLKVDGDFGNNTRKAVLNFQNSNGLVADGIVGPKTWAKLNK